MFSRRNFLTEAAGDVVYAASLFRLYPCCADVEPNVATASRHDVVSGRTWYGPVINRMGRYGGPKGTKVWWGFLHDEPTDA